MYAICFVLLWLAFAALIEHILHNLLKTIKLPGEMLLLRNEA